MDKHILVIKKNTLFQDNYFNGFSHSDDHNFEDIILDNYEYIRRGDAEINPAYKQPIGYAIIFNPETKKIFAYQRSPQGAQESRLHNKWSCGIGGHIDKEDSEEVHPIHTSMHRELHEEVYIQHINSIKTLGYINYDDDDVGKVHFGILYLIETSDNDIRPKADEMKQGNMYTPDELEEILSSSEYDVEDWTRIALLDGLRIHNY